MPFFRRSCELCFRVYLPLLQFLRLHWVWQAYLYPSKSFILFSNYLSALLLLRTASRSYPIVLHILQWLFRLSVKYRSVEFCRVPSHVGIPGIETVDALAARATIRSPCIPFRSVPVSDFFPAFAKLITHRLLTHAIKPFVTPCSPLFSSCSPLGGGTSRDWPYPFEPWPFDV